MLLDALPLEILNLILAEIKHTIPFQELCRLRLVSRIFAAAIEPLVFSRVTLAPRRNPKCARQIQHLMSGQSPNSRWTTKVAIAQGGHIDLSPVEGGLGAGSEESEGALISAIESLQSVKFTLFDLDSHRPYSGVIRALSRLPALEELVISFHYDSRRLRPVDLPSCTFSKLRALRFNRMKLTPSAVESLKEMLARNTELESLALVWYNAVRADDEVPVLALDEVFPPSLPRLTSLTINADRLGLSASCAPVFPSLSHLNIDNAIAATVDPSLWEELSKGGVQLKTLHIYPITPSIIRYLESYSGLVKLQLARSHYGVQNRRVVKDDTSSKAFNAALTMHKRTLVHLAYSNLPWKKYGITDDRLQGILECKQLETLWLTCHFPSETKEDYSNDFDDFEDDDEDRNHSEEEDEEEGEGTQGSPSYMDMTLLLSSLASNLPHLKQLTLEAKRDIPDLGWCGNAYDDYEDDMARAFEKVVRDAKAAVQASGTEGSSSVQEVVDLGFRIQCLPSYRSWDSDAEF